MTAAATMIQLELWQLLAFGVGLLVAFLGCVFGAARWYFEANETRLAERFDAISKANDNGLKHIAETVRRHIEEDGRLLEQIPRMERQFLEFKADLPLNYVRREDYIRGQSVIEAKLDALAVRMENAQLRKGAE